MTVPIPAPLLRPTVGFCLRTESAGSPPGRWYVNMCKHRMVEMPIAPSGKPASKEWLLTHGLGNLQLPFDMGSFRKLKERCDGARHTTYCVDVVFNPLIVQLFMDDDFCRKMESYRTWVVNIALNRIESSIGVKLSAQKVQLQKAFRYKDGEGSDNAPREFTDLPGEKDGYGFDDGDPSMPAPPKESPADMGPLIEEVSPGRRKKPVMKKGFLNSKDADLYGPEGSKEGVLPENAGDPMGWMPKKLRQNSKIVDCNAPEYQEHERQRKAAEEHNKMGQELRDSLTSGFDALFKKQQQDPWEADAPEGTEQPVACKYDNDYSRFDRIEEEAEAPPKDDRDWYYDSSGQQRRIERRPSAAQSPSPATAAAEASAAPAVKKGFLSDAKKPLYGPEGSTQVGTPMDDKELMKQFSELLREDKDFAAELAGGDAARPPKTAPMTVKKAAEGAAASFTLGDAAEGGALQLVVAVPGLASMQDVNLDVTERRASFEFPKRSGLRPLHVDLPADVVPTAVRAKFSKKTQQITITLPKNDAA